MSIWKRAIIYLKRNKKRTAILTFMLMAISTVLITCFSIWQGCQSEMEKLKNKYGKSFVVETLVGEDKIKYFTDERTGRQMSYYTGPVVDKELVEKISSLDSISDVCYESITELVTFRNITYIPGLWLNDVEEFRKNPEEYQASYDEYWDIEQISKENTIRGYNETELCSDFQTNNLEIVRK